MHNRLTSDLESRVKKLEISVLNESLNKTLNPNGFIIRGNSVDYIINAVENKICNALGVSSGEFFNVITANSLDISDAKELSDIIIKLINNSNTEIPSVTLYRGCSDFEYNNIISTGRAGINKVLSFSENKNLASTFGRNLIAAEFKAPAFPLYKLALCYYNSLRKSLAPLELEDEDLLEYGITDLSGLISMSEDEAEWLVLPDIVFNKNKRSNTFIADVDASVKSTVNSKSNISKPQLISKQSDESSIFVDLCKANKWRAKIISTGVCALVPEKDLGLFSYDYAKVYYMSKNGTIVINGVSKPVNLSPMSPVNFKNLLIELALSF